MMEKPFVSVVIPVFNDCRRLLLCLKALQDQSYSKDRYEVVVVDNGMNEGIEKIFSQFSQARLAVETKPGSYAARNKGIALSKGEVIAFTDSDCIPTPDWLSRGVERLTGTSHCGIVGGKVERFFKVSCRPNLIERYDSAAYLNQESAIREFHGVATANVFTFKRIFEQLGAFNESVYTGEDYRWARRAYEHGWGQVYAPEAVVKHPARSTLRALYSRIARQEGLKHMRNCVEDKSLQFYLRPDLFVKNLWLASCDDPRLIKRCMTMIALFIVTLFVVACMVFEFVRFLCGGRPSRQ